MDLDAARRDGLLLLARRQHGVFTWGQAIGVGYPPGTADTAVRRGLWVRQRHGVYATREEVAARQGNAAALHALTCAAEVLAIGGDPVVSHTWAASLHTMPFLGRLDKRVELTREPTDPRRRPERRSLHHAGLPASHVTTAFGVPVSRPARTAIDLARRDGVRAGVVAADAAIQRESTVADLEAVARHCWHWPGGADGMAAAALARPGSESALESIGRLAFVDEGAPEPELQVEVLRFGVLIGRLDQLWRGLLLAAEADGAVKYGMGQLPLDPRALYDEKLRQENLEQCGLAILRYDWDDAWSGQRQLCGRWREKAANAASRRLAPGVVLRATTRARAA